jgi:hypothetical protein
MRVIAREQIHDIVERIECVMQRAVAAVVVARDAIDAERALITDNTVTIWAV